MAVFGGALRIFVLTFTCSRLLIRVHSNELDVTVKTNAGYFIGIKEDVEFGGSTRSVAKFRGIPYAEPPTGAYRFRRPRPKQPLKKPMLAKNYAPGCLGLFSPAPVGSESEDCLYLNVYVPDGFDFESLPVMVFISGGSFQYGSSNIYESDRLAAFGRVIVVTFNYRVNIWGFLSTGDGAAAGNYGLWDQQLALKWVHENIEAFGGDTGRVTVFGESAGAVSVIFQGLFRGNEGLFQRLIALSGSPSAYWVTKQTPRESLGQFAATVGCYNETVAMTVNCLRDLPATTISESLRNVSRQDSLNFTFMPVNDNAFVSCDPGDVLNANLNSESFASTRANFVSLDLMTGVNSGDGVINMLPSNGYGDPETFLPNKTYFDEVLVPILVNNVYGDSLSDATKEQVVKAIIETYTYKNDPENEYRIREQFIYMHGDAVFFAPKHDVSQLHAKYSSRNLYIYYLTFKPNNHVLTTPSWFQGTNHADELQYLFRNIPLNDIEVVLANKLIAMVTNFAKTGNPNKPVDIGVEWEPYTLENQRYLEITRNMTEQNMKEDFAEDRIRLWNVRLPKLVGYEPGSCDYEYTSAAVPCQFQHAVVVVVILSAMIGHLLTKSWTD